MALIAIEFTSSELIAFDKLGSSSLSLNDLNLSATTFIATLDNNEINDYNNLSSNILNQTDRFQLTVNKTNKKIEANKVLDFEKIIIEFLYKKDDINYQKIVNVDLIPNVLEINVSGCELIDDDTKLQITYAGTLNDSQINVNNLTSILLDNQTDDITLNNNIITINDITTDKIFNVKFTYNNVENIKQISTKIVEQNNE